jgi:hypothetical protein
MNKQGSAKGKENTSYSAMLNIEELVPPPELVTVAGIESNYGVERNSWGSVRIHRDGIPGIGWNWFRNFQHRGIG